MCVYQEKSFNLPILNNWSLKSVFRPGTIALVAVLIELPLKKLGCQIEADLSIWLATYTVFVSFVVITIISFQGRSGERD